MNGDPKPTRKERLLRASQLVESVRAELNVKEACCDSCGMNKKADWAEFQAADELEAVVRKLQRFAGASSITKEG